MASERPVYVKGAQTRCLSACSVLQVGSKVKVKAIQVTRAIPYDAMPRHKKRGSYSYPLTLFHLLQDN
jgi:hypothetical protein